MNRHTAFINLQEAVQISWVFFNLRAGLGKIKKTGGSVFMN